MGFSLVHVIKWFYIKNKLSDFFLHMMAVFSQLELLQPVKNG